MDHETPKLIAALITTFIAVCGAAFGVLAWFMRLGKRINDLERGGTMEIRVRDLEEKVRATEEADDSLHEKQLTCQQRREQIETQIFERLNALAACMNKMEGKLDILVNGQRRRAD